MTALVVLAGAGWLLALPPLAVRALTLLGMTRPNFRGEVIPLGLGLVTLLWSVPVLVYAGRAMPDRRPECLAMAALVAGFGLLGFVDDRWGDRSVGGLRGHLRKAVLDGEVTTGFVKLAGGALLAFVVPWRLLHHAWTDALLEGAIIAMAANALNLLDLRPGRAGAVFLLIALPVTAFAWDMISPPALLFVAIPALVVYERDARAKAMMGDTGSNLLGAALGASVILQNPSAGVKWGLLSALLALHIVAERWSLTRLIEHNAILRRLDRMTGQR